MPGEHRSTCIEPHLRKTQEDEPQNRLRVVRLLQPGPSPKLIRRRPEALLQGIGGEVFFRGGSPDHVCKERCVKVLPTKAVAALDSKELRMTNVAISSIPDTHSQRIRAKHPRQNGCLQMGRPHIFYGSGGRMSGCLRCVRKFWVAHGLGISSSKLRILTSQFYDGKLTAILCDVRLMA